MKKEKFKSLFTKGPVFPEVYRPQGYKLAGEKLSNLAEEMLWKAARFIDSDYEKEAFVPNGNMWQCLKPELSTNQQKLSFPNDFLPLIKKMKQAQIDAKEAKKSLTKEEKLAEKAAKDKLKEEFGTAILDGKTVKLQNFMIEAPNWILTRGKDPRKFCWKYAVNKSDVTLNIVGHKPPAGWNVVSDNTKFWVMKYKINCGLKSMPCFRQLNKVILCGEGADMMYAAAVGKYDKAAKILKNWKNIQAKIDAGCQKGEDEAIILYLIQHTGIRIGNERDEKKQALTYGMQTLEFQHMKLHDSHGFEVEFDFLGKDSVPDQRTITVNNIVFNELKKRLANKKNGDKIFGNVNVNGYLRKIMPGITVKNLRTVVCNETLIKNLKIQNVTKNNTEAEKLRAIFLANLEIAKTMNHQKNVGKNQKEGEQKIAERVKKSKERAAKLKKNQKEKLAKLNEKADKYKTLYANMPKMLKEKLAEIDEAKTKLTIQIEKAKTNIEKVELALDKKKLTKDVSLGTSLTSYADLRIIKSYCDEIELPMEKLFSKGRMFAINEMTKNTPRDYWRKYPS